MTQAPSSCPASVDTIVLGAGIAGLAAAHALSATGGRLLVIDQADTCGGTHRSRNIGPYTFDVGSIFFETTAPIFDLAPELRARCLPVRRRQQRITPQGGLAHYPFEPREILSWPLRTRLAALGDLLARGFYLGTPKNVEELCRARLGKTIYMVSGLRNYITRFHQEPPSGIGANFFRKRMGFVDRAAGPWALLSQASSLLWPRPKAVRAALLVRPVRGFGEIYDPIQKSLEARGVAFLLGQAIDRIEHRDGGGFMVQVGGRELVVERIVSTIPVANLHRLVFGEAPRLEGLDLLSLFVSAPKGSQVEGNVLFNFHGEGRWKRLTLYSDIYVTEPGLSRTRDFFTVEVTCRQDEKPDPAAAFNDFTAHMTTLGLFPPGLRLEGFETVRNAYPLYRPHTGAVVAAMLERLTAFGIVSAGRQGRFEYLPVSSLVIRRTWEELAAQGLTDPAPSEPPSSGRFATATEPPKAGSI